jgi:hypothetical protein
MQWNQLHLPKDRGLPEGEQLCRANGSEGLPKGIYPQSDSPASRHLDAEGPTSKRSAVILNLGERMKLVTIGRTVLGLSLGLLTAAGYGQDISGMHGWIEDGLTKTPGTASADVKKNVGNGAKYVFVDDQSKNVWVIDDPEVVKGHEGHHVSIDGGIDKVSKTVHIGKLTMLKDQSPGAAADAVGR